MAPDELDGKKFCDQFVVCCKLVSLLTKLLILTQKNQLVLCGQLYIADCKDKGACNTLKPYLPKEKTVVVLKVLLLKRVWVPGFVHPCVIKLCVPLMPHT